MASPVIQFKRGDYSNLPALQAGEPALTLDTFEFYIGINSTTEENKFFGSHRYFLVFLHFLVQLMQMLVLVLMVVVLHSNLVMVSLHKKLKRFYLKL